MSNHNTKAKLKTHNKQHSDTQPRKYSLLLTLIMFIVWVTATVILMSLISFTLAYSKPIATDTNSGYDGDLSKNVSGQASRDLLAFFMFDTSAAPQAVTTQSSIALQAHTGATRAQTIISIADHLLTDYDGLTLQNKTAERQICRAVTNVTESKTRHPIRLSYSVAFTQKTLGVIHHG